MNNKQLDMVLGYLNEGTEIDEIEFMVESINEEIKRFDFINEEVEILNEGKVVEFVKKLIEGVKVLISKLKNFLVTKFAKFIKLIREKASKLQDKTLSQRFKQAVSKLKSSNESTVLEASIADFENLMKEKYVIYFIDFNKFSELLEKIKKFTKDADHETLEDDYLSKTVTESVYSFSDAVLGFNGLNTRVLNDKAEFEKTQDEVEKSLNDTENQIKKLESAIKSIKVDNFDDLPDGILRKNELNLEIEKLKCERTGLQCAYKFLSLAISKEMINIQRLSSIKTSANQIINDANQ